MSIPYTKWWHSFLISFSISTWIVAQPFYGFLTDPASILSVQVGEAKTAPAILLIVLIFQALPTLLLFLLERAIISLWGTGKLLVVYRALLFSISILVFVRLVQMNIYVPLTYHWPILLRLVIMTVGVAFIIGIAIYWHRIASLFFLYLSAVSIILTGVFLIEIDLFNSPWETSYTSQEITLSSSAVKAPIIIMILDGQGSIGLIDSGEINPRLFPNLAGLAEDSALFTNSTSNYYDSVHSIGSLMTGDRNRVKVPGVDDARKGILGYGPDGLLTLLEDEGYMVEAFDGFRLCANKSLQCTDQLFLNLEQPHLFVQQASYYFMFTRFIPERITRSVFLWPFPANPHNRPLWDVFMSRITASNSIDKVFFLRIMLPHQPYEFDRFGDFNTAPLWGWDDAGKMKAAYEKQVMFVDTLVGEMIDRLKSEGIYNQTFIAITGDHGPRGLGTMNSDFPEEMSEAIPRVPLIMHGPSITPQKSSVDYQHLDFVPTLLDVLDLAPIEELNGVSAFGSPHPTRDKIFNFVACGHNDCSKESYLYKIPYVLSKKDNRWIIKEGHSCDNIDAYCSG